MKKYYVLQKDFAPAVTRPFLIDYENELNPAQLEAVRILEGPVLVIAGAGRREDRVLELIAQYDQKESKMIPIIQEQKSMLKALAVNNRY